MIKYNFLKNILSIILVLFLSYNIYFLLNILSYSFCFADDYDIIFDTKSNILKEPLFGLYLSSTLDRIFAYVIPNALDIHPSDFSSTYFKYIEIFIIFCLPFIYSKILYKKYDFKSFIICFLYSLNFILFQLQEYPFYWLYVYEGLFRMFLPTILFIFLFYFFTKEKQNKTDSTIIVCLCLICTTSNEMISITTCFGLFFYHILSRKLKLYHNLKYNILYLLVSLTGIATLLNTKTFFRMTNTSTLEFNYFYNLLPLFPEFFTKYINFIFFKHWLELSILIIIIVLIYKLKYTNKNRNKILYISSFLLSIWIFFFLLIGLGKTYYDPDKFWIIHPDLHYIYSFILYSFIFSLISTFIDKIKHINIVINILFLILSIFFSYKNNVFYNEFIETKIKPQRLETYKTEKIIRLANLRNKTAIISNKILKYPLAWEFHCVIDEKENTHFILFHNQFKKKINIKYYFEFENDNIVENEFRNNGGIFTEEELNNIKFTRLLDDNFLLNNKQQ